MATRWYLWTNGRETGPVLFGDLVQMVQTGRLAEQDLVRPDYDHLLRWQRAEEVVGLFYMARRNDSATTRETNRPTWRETDALPTGVIGGTSRASVAPQSAVSHAHSAPAERAAEMSSDRTVAQAAEKALVRLDHRSAQRRASLRASSSPWRLLVQECFRQGLVRHAAAAAVASAAGVWVHLWSARESLRFPGLFDESVRSFPLWGECRVALYWALLADLMFLAGVSSYFLVRWVENRLEDA